MAGFFVENFGCRAARADGESIRAQLWAQGLAEESLKDANVIIVNTCSVTEEADRSARAFIRRTHRQNPTARIVVTGCYAQRAPEELAALAGVRAVVGNSHKAMASAVAVGLATTEPVVPVASAGPAAWVAPAALAGPAAQLVSVQSLIRGVQILVDDRFAHSFMEESQVLASALTEGAASPPGRNRTQTRPNLKIQEGCDNRCTFCVIPQTRGSSRSLLGVAVLRQVEGFVAAGGKELVLSGINLGRWGRDREALDKRGDLDSRSLTGATENQDGGSSTPLHFAQNDGKDWAEGVGGEACEPRSLATLVRRIFTETSLERLRLSSIEPMDWTDELIGFFGEFRTRLARHAHLPLQSGSDAVLRRMHRRYRPWHYEAKVEALVKAAGPELTLGADVMVGFPGETDAEFEETVAMICALPFGYLHLFPFSRRPGTRGWALHESAPIARESVEERMAVLRDLAFKKSFSHRQRLLGCELEAITLESSAAEVQSNCTSALTENFLPVELAGRWPRNQMVRVRLTGLRDDGALTGECCKASG